MSGDNGKLILPEPQPEEKKPTDILIVDIDEQGRIRMNIKTNDERLLILTKHYVNEAITGLIYQNQAKQKQIEIAQVQQTQSILNRMRGK